MHRCALVTVIFTANLQARLPIEYTCMTMPAFEFCVDWHRRSWNCSMAGPGVVKISSRNERVCSILFLRAINDTAQPVIYTRAVI